MEKIIFCQIHYFLKQIKTFNAKFCLLLKGVAKLFKNIKHTALRNVTHVELEHTPCASLIM